jgi:hypothetical protein
MSEPDDLSRMLAEYRGSLQPNASDRARVRRAIAAVEERRAWWRALWWRSGALAAVAAAVLVLALTWVRARGIAGEASERSSPSEAPRAVEGPRPETVREREIPPRTRAPAEAIAPAVPPSEPPPSEPRARTLPSAPALPSAPVSATDAVRAEAALVERARRALDDGAHDEVITLCGEHTRRFADGVLAVEVGALRALALCEAGRRAQGRGEAQVFLREHPRAPYRDRIRRACALEDPEGGPR